MDTTTEIRGIATEEMVELQKIAKANGGLLNPPDIVEYARNPRTELHKRFEWDNTKAAEEYRLWQAREVIRVIVSVVDINGKNHTVKAFVSLPEDRGGGGYRAIVDVMKMEYLRLSMLEEAKSEMRRFREKYAALSELAKVFEEMDRV
jgi:hypothetical protein